MKKFEDLLSQNKLFDSHTHLESLNDPEQAIANAVNSEVEYLVDVAIDVQTAQGVLQRSQNNSSVLATAGIHPEYLIPGTDIGKEEPWLGAKIEEELTDLTQFLAINHTQITMLGECGLDWYWLNKANLTLSELKTYKARQIYLFEKQIELAQKYALPLTIHTRESFTDAIDQIKSQHGNLRFVFHSFTSNYVEAKQVLDLGGYLGINGIITYQSANELRTTVRQILGRVSNLTPQTLYQHHLVLETDAPYLRPANATNSHKQNEPQNIMAIFQFLEKLLA